MIPDEDRSFPDLSQRRSADTGDAPTTPGGASEADSVLQNLKGAASAPAPAPAPIPTAFPQVPGYEILSELGHGGMGVVYKARQLSLNRIVALKMVLSEHVPANEVARFRAEAEAVAAVTHPNVVELYDLCPLECARPYFTMEYVPGGSLAGFLKARGPLAPRAAAKLLAAVADGLQVAHDEGIIHRDVKPGNILLSKDEGRGMRDEPETGSDSSLIPRPSSLLRPKVSDFGLAKRLASDVTRTQGPKGTPAYMAPEQAAGTAQYVGPGADVYALGAVLYECLTGKPPFEGTDQWAVVQQVLGAAPVSPRVRVPGLPRDIELICLKCLEKEPHRRYRTAAALAADLRRFLAGEPVLARPIGTVARVARWAKRHPAPAALVSLVALLFTVVPTVVVWSLGQFEKQATDTANAQETARLARIAQEQEEVAKTAALRHADARDLFALQNVLRTRAANRPLSWTRENRDDLPKAVALAGADPAARGDLRSAAAVALLAADLEPLDPAVNGFDASAIATDPHTGRVAIGESRTWGALVPRRVRLLDPATGVVEREWTVPSGVVRGASGELKKDHVCSLAFSPDGTRLFVGTKSSLLIRIDVDKPDRTPAAVWTASTSPLEQLAVSPDGTRVFGLCRPEKPVFVWDAGTGKLVKKLEPSADAPFTSFTVLGNGDVIACAANQIHRWSESLELVQTVPNTGAGRVADACGALLVGNGSNLDVYDRETLAPLARTVTSALWLGAHEGYVRTIAVHPSGAFVATAGSDDDRTVRVWEMASSRLVGAVTVRGTGPVAVAWSGDGATLLATADRHLARWSFRSPEAQRFGCASGPPVAAAAFASENRLAALTEPVAGQREVIVGAAGTHARSARFAERGGNGRAGVTGSHAGTLALSPAMHGLIASEPGNPVPAPAFVGDITWCPRFAPDGRALWAVVGSSNVWSFDPGTKKVLTKWSNQAENTFVGLGSLDALAVGRTLVVAGGRSGTVHILDAGTGKRVAGVPRSGDQVVSLALAPDESLIVAGTQNGDLRVIRTSDREELSVAAHTGGVTAVSLSRDGTLLATGGRDRVVRLWKRVGDGFEPLLAVSDLSGPVRELQFHAADDRLLVLVAQERAVRVWDVARLRTQLGEFDLAW